MAAGFDARDELGRREEAAAAKQFADLAGKCFTFSNSYGGEERWPIYRRVISVDGSSATVCDIEVQHGDRAEASREQRRLPFGSDWQPITYSQFQEGCATFMCAVARWATEGQGAAK